MVQTILLALRLLRLFFLYQALRLARNSCPHAERWYGAEMGCAACIATRKLMARFNPSRTPLPSREEAP